MTTPTKEIILMKTIDMYVMENPEKTYKDVMKDLGLYKYKSKFEYNWVSDYIHKRIGGE